MRVLIIEDEPLAAQRLKSLVLRYESHIQVLGPLDSVKSAVNWLRAEPAPDLILLDIQLADGSSFSIFDQVKVDAPIIFTTAFDEYAIQAFKLNSVDYLLKPLDYEEVAGALDKYVKRFHLQKPSPIAGLDLAALRDMVLDSAPRYKQRFVVKKGEHLLSVPVEEILYFYSEEKVSFFRTLADKRYMLDLTLAEIEDKVDPAVFFRINRKYLVAHAALSDIVAFSNRRLKVSLKFQPDERVLVSREKVSEFKAWLG